MFQDTTKTRTNNEYVTSVNAFWLKTACSFLNLIANALVCLEIMVCVSNDENCNNKIRNRSLTLVRLKLATVVVVGQPSPPNTWAWDTANREAAITRNIMVGARTNPQRSPQTCGYLCIYPGELLGTSLKLVNQTCRNCNFYSFLTLYSRWADKLLALP